MRNVPGPWWPAHATTGPPGPHLRYIVALLRLIVLDEQALQEISALYFGLPPPRQAAANPFGDMLSSMFGGGGSAAQPAPRRLAPPPTSGLD
jgi:hypothetical protein